MNSNDLDVRVYPIGDPKGATLAFASVAMGDLAAIRGIRVVDSIKGPFVAMPQSQDNTGIYHDIAFPLTGELRKTVNAVVLGEFEYQASLSPDQRGYEKFEPDANARDASDIKLDVKVFPIAEPKGDTLAFASAGLDSVVAIRGIRVVDSGKGPFVSMPQSRDKSGEYHDVAFPLSGGLRKALSNAVLAEYRQQSIQKKQSIGTRLAEGRDAAARHNREHAARPRELAAKRSPGLGD
jgi:stage V sporulation protein G